MKVTLIGSSIFSYGLRLVSASLRRAGHQVILVLPTRDTPYIGDRIYADPVLDRLADLARGSGWIGLSVISNWRGTAAQITAALRRRLDAPIVWGGIYPSVAPPEQALAEADWIIRGEGEAAAVALAGGADPAGVANLAWRDGGRIRENPRAPLVAELDALPFPDYDYEGSHYLMSRTELVPMTAANFAGNTFFAQRALASIPGEPVGYHTLTSRGCPHSCAYCCNSALRRLAPAGARYLRFRSPASIAAEIETICRRHPAINLVAFEDDEFSARPVAALEEFAALWRARCGLPFRCYVSPTYATPAKLRLLRHAGAIDIGMGIESGSARVLKSVYNRSCSREQILAATRAIHDEFADVNPPVYDLILDNPYETWHDYRETLRLVNGIPRPFLLILFSLTLFSGTALADRALADGLVDADGLRDGDRKSSLVRSSRSRTGYLRLLLRLLLRGRLPGWLLELLAHPAMLALGGLGDAAWRRLKPPRPSWDIGPPQ